MAAATEGMSGGRAVLLGALVVAVTGGLIYLLGRSDGDETPREDDAVQQEVLEVHPLVPQGAVRSASWHDAETTDGNDTEAAADAEQDEPASLLDALGKDEDEDGEHQRHLEKVVSEIHGLGVYVAPPGADDGKPKGSGKRK